MSRIFRRSLIACCLASLLAFLALPSRSQSSDDDDADDTNPTAAEIREHYTKHEYRIPMRDGTKLFTAVYIPKDTSQSYPFLIDRTPYTEFELEVTDVNTGARDCYRKIGFVDDRRQKEKFGRFKGFRERIYMRYPR